MSADIFLIATDISFSFCFPRNPCSAAPFPRYFKWWLCFQNELKEEAAVAQEAEPHWLQSLPLYHPLSLSAPLAGWAWGEGRGGGGWFAGMCARSDWWRIFRRRYFHYLGGQNNISEVYLKVIIALFSILTSCPRNTFTYGDLHDWKHLRHFNECDGFESVWEEKRESLKVSTRQKYIITQNNFHNKKKIRYKQMLPLRVSASFNGDNYTLVIQDLSIFDL